MILFSLLEVLSEFNEISSKKTKRFNWVETGRIGECVSVERKFRSTTLFGNDFSHFYLFN